MCSFFTTKDISYNILDVQVDTDGRLSMVVKNEPAFTIPWIMWGVKVGLLFEALLVPFPTSPKPKAQTKLFPPHITLLHL